MKLIDIFEGVSSILFHATSPATAVAAVQQDKMWGFSLDDKFVLSFARSRTGEYPKYMGDDMAGSSDPIVVLELNGTRLGQRYKGQPVDAFAPKPGDFDYGDYDRTTNYTEDRIYNKTKDFYIPPGTFIRAHLIENGNEKSHKELTAATKRIEAVIPCVFYKTIEDFQSNRSIPALTPPVSNVVDPAPFMTTIFQALSGSQPAAKKFLSYPADQVAAFKKGIMQRMRAGDQEMRGDLSEIARQLFDVGHIDDNSEVNTIDKLIDVLKRSF